MAIYFSNNLKRLRTDRNMTQEQLGKIVGKGKNAIYYWEEGTREPKLEDIFKLSNFFGVPADVLLFNDVTEPYAPTVNQRIIDDYASLDSNSQRVVNDMITALKK